MTYRVRFPEMEIAERIAHIASILDGRYGAERPVTALVILKGGYFFGTHLLSCMTARVEVEFIQASAYGDERQPASVLIHTLAPVPVDGKDVLLIDDIVDTGSTMAAVRRVVENGGARSVTTVALLWRVTKGATEPDVVGFRIRDDDWLVGYGMDNQGFDRNLSFIGTPD